MQKNPKLKTGFTFLDQKWGGVFSGGNYLVFGPKKSGKTVLVLNIMDYLTEGNQKTLFLTSERKKNLEIQASSIYFDVNEAISKGSLTVIRINEEFKSLDVIKSKIEQLQPTFLIIDEILDDNFSEVRSSYLDLLEFLENLDITTFLVSSFPRNENSRRFIKNVAKNSTGIIHLSKSVENRNYSGVLTIKPNIGHFEGEFETSYKIEPIKGIITLSDNENAIMEILSKVDKNDVIDSKDDFDYTNLYGYEEFKFLIESRIALAKRTGDKINLIIFEFLTGDLKPVEIYSAIKGEFNKGDKISYSENKLFILPEKNELTYVNKLYGLIETEIKNIIGSEDNLDSYYIGKNEILRENFNID